MNKLNIVIVFISLLLLGKNLIRDLQLSEKRVGDLRNRVVGARMQKDGLSPYFHKWKAGETARYYDPANEDGRRVSSCTATPFFHLLLYPMAELPYSVASHVWIYALYGLLIGTGLLAALQTRPSLLSLICLLTVAFTFTETWLDNVVTKQSYMFIPFFTMMVYYFIKKGQENHLLIMIAGVSAVFLLLTRPNSILLIFPLVFIQQRFSLKAKVYFLFPIFLGIILTLCTSQLGFWSDYFAAMAEHVKIHQGLVSTVQHFDLSPFREIEGFNLQGYQNEVIDWYKPYVEHANVFWLVKVIFNYQMTIGQLFFLSNLLAILLYTVFFLSKKKRNMEFKTEDVFMLGFGVFMLSDLFSPVFRGQYNSIQWLFPLLLICTDVKRVNLWLYGVFVIAFVLSLHFKPVLLMQHTVAEYMWLGSSLLYVFSKGRGSCKELFN